MVGYWKSDSLVFMGKSGPTYGYKNTLANYKKNYPDTSYMGKLHFDIVSIKPLGKNYFFVIEKGFKQAMANGVLAGYPVDSLKVRVYDGSYHAVDSDAMSFEIAAKVAFREACRKANPVLLEPIMKIEILTPEEYMGDVIGDLNKRRGQLDGMDSRAGAQVIKARVPLSEMFGYVTQLRTLSSGRASSTMEFDHYAETPRNVSEEVLAKVNGKASKA